jgi:hypothetical protein
MNSILAEITWRPAIGDPEPIGWIITFSYFIAGGFCVSAGRHQRAFSIRRGCIGYPWFWFGLAVFMFALGVNKQLDLQTLLIQIGRNVAMRGGWYSDRNSIRSVVVFICAAIASPILFAWMFVVCNRGRSYLVACLGVLILLAFVGIRALSFNPRIQRLMHLPLIGHHLNTVMELAGATLVCLGARWVTRSNGPNGQKRLNIR